MYHEICMGNTIICVKIVICVNVLCYQLHYKNVDCQTLIGSFEVNKWHHCSGVRLN